MTCIVALKTSHHTWIGADSCVTDGWLVSDHAGDIKLFKHGPFVIGFAGVVRDTQLIRYFAEFPPQTADQTDMAYMVAVADVLRKTLDGRSSSVSGPDQPSYMESNSLFVYQQQIYSVDARYGVVHRPEYWAIGLGNALALGALAATPELEPEQRLTTALEVAARYTEGVRPPFRLICV